MKKKKYLKTFNWVPWMVFEPHIKTCTWKLTDLPNPNSNSSLNHAIPNLFALPLKSVICSEILWLLLRGPYFSLSYLHIHFLDSTPPLLYRYMKFPFYYFSQKMVNCLARWDKDNIQKLYITINLSTNFCGYGFCKL